MATKPIRSDAGVNCGAGVASWQGPAGVGGAYYKAGVGLVARRHDNTELVLNSPSTLYSSVANVSSVTSGETDAHVYTMPANTLFADGQMLEIVIGTSHAANTNSATYRLYLDGTALVNQPRTVASEPGMTRVTIVRAASNLGRWVAHIQNGGTLTGNTSAQTLTYTNPIIIKTTVEGPTAAGDMIARFMRVSFWP